MDARSHDSWRGWLNGFVGVAIFSASLPATRAAVLALDPMFVTLFRAAAAGLLGAALLFLLDQPRPRRADLAPLATVGAGVVIGFPLLTALALREITSAHAMVFLGLLPLATASCAVLRGAPPPRPAFWLFAGIGGALVGGYALWQGGAEGSLHGDLLLLAAILACGLGYAEGAALSRRLGGWQVISWSLLLSLPITLPGAILMAPAEWSVVGWPAVAGLAYVSVFSMFVGFVFWYRGLAQGGVVAVSQLQLLQPFLGLTLAALLLGEPVGGGLVAAAVGVGVCVVGARRFAAA